MSLRLFAWTEILAAVAISILVPIAVEVFGRDSSLYIFIPIAWVAAVIFVPILFRVDRQVKERRDA